MLFFISKIAMRGWYMKAAGPSGSMDASEYKEYIFGILFLKRSSDLFDQRQAEVRQQAEADGLTEADTLQLLEDPDQYSGPYFFAPSEPAGAPRGPNARPTVTANWWSPSTPH